MTYETAKTLGAAFGVMSAIGVGLSILFNNVMITQDYLDKAKRYIEESKVYFNSGQIEKAKESIENARHNLPRKNILTMLVEYDVPGTLARIDNLDKEISKLEKKLK